MLKYSILLVCVILLPLSGCAKKPIENSASAVDKNEAVVVQPIASQEIPLETPSADDHVEKAAAKTGPAMETIYFEFDSSVLGTEARQILENNARSLRNNAAVTIIIKGHTDERGSDAYNLALGERRARAAFNYLVTMGIAPERLSIISYGEEMPADTGHREASWAKNRRVEF